MVKLAVASSGFDPERQHLGQPRVRFPADAFVLHFTHEYHPVEPVTIFVLPYRGTPRLRGAQHAAAAVAKHSRRGWRIDKTERADNIDAIVALAMAVERAEARPEPARVLGWV